MAMWKAKESSMGRGREKERKKKKKKYSMSVADSYQKCWPGRFCSLDAKLVRLYTDENRRNVYDGCLLQYKKTNKKKNNTRSTRSSVCSSHQYQIPAVQQLPKVTPDWSSCSRVGVLWAAARAVSVCKTGDTETGGHCQAGLSQRVLLLVDRNSQTAVNGRHTVVLCFQGFSCRDTKR